MALPFHVVEKVWTYSSNRALTRLTLRAPNRSAIITYVACFRLDPPMVTGQADLQAAFAQRLQSVGGETCERGGLVEMVLACAHLFPDRPVIYTAGVRKLVPSLIEGVQGAGVSCNPAQSLDDALACPVAIIGAELAIAETGSVVIAQDNLVLRAPSMLAAINLVLVPADRLVASLDEAAAWLSARVTETHHISFVTGPSRTADIERTLTIGVQGPARLIVAFIPVPNGLPE